MSRSQAQIEAEIEKVKAELAELGRFRPGTLSRQARARGDLYFQITFSQKGKARCEYVRPDYEPVIREEVRNYRRLRDLVRQWIDLELELSRIRQLAHAKRSQGNGTQQPAPGSRRRRKRADDTAGTGDDREEGREDSTYRQ